MKYFSFALLFLMAALEGSLGTDPESHLGTARVNLESEGAINTHEERDFLAEIRQRRSASSHTNEEIIAQSICESMQIVRNLAGWVYAIERVCNNITASCTSICATCYLHVQDAQTVQRTWSTLGALHVYKGRPASSAGTDTNPVMGLKTYWSSGYHTGKHCGPNYCCCHAR